MKKIITIILFAFSCGCGPSREEIKQKEFIEQQQQGQNTRLIRIGTFDAGASGRDIICL
jgi:hypothetical protein